MAISSEGKRMNLEFLLWKIPSTLDRVDEELYSKSMMKKHNLVKYGFDPDSVVPIFERDSKGRWSQEGWLLTHPSKWVYRLSNRYVHDVNPICFVKKTKWFFKKQVFSVTERSPENFVLSAQELKYFSFGGGIGRVYYTTEEVRRYIDNECGIRDIVGDVLL